jgi:putative acyl-CoA dehydrogenase
MHNSVLHAVHHASHRSVFGKVLIKQPLMTSVLCDLALEVEGATALAMRVAESFDDPDLAAFRRIAVAIGKFYVCKRAPAVVAEALECLGGNGFVEDFPLARMYRQAPLNGLWEGSGNVMILDVFRAMTTQAVDALRTEVKSTQGLDPVVEAQLESSLAGMRLAGAEGVGRGLVTTLALVLEACALRRCAPDVVYECFIESRFRRRGQGVFGDLTPTCVRPEILQRFQPIFEKPKSRL